MKCKIDPTGMCQSHGVQMDASMAEMSGTLCPIGYIAEIEKRFDFTSKEVKESLRAVHARFSLLGERLGVIEDKLGIESGLFDDA